MADENGEQPAELPKRPSSPDSFLRESDIPTPPPPKIIPRSPKDVTSPQFLGSDGNNK